MVLRNGSPRKSSCSSRRRLAERPVDARAVHVGHLASEAAADDRSGRCVFDRYRSYLPAQIRSADRPVQRHAGEFRGHRQPDHLECAGAAARLHLRPDRQRQDGGESELRAVLVESGTTSIDSLVNPNAPDWYDRYNWTDNNDNGVWQPGEQGAAPTSRRRRRQHHSIPNLQDTRTRESRLRLERELFAELRRARRLRLSPDRSAVTERQPESSGQRLQRADHGPDPGPNGMHHGGRARRLQAFNLNPANLALPVVNFLHNTPGQGRFLQPRTQREQAPERPLVAERVVSRIAGIATTPTRLLRPEPAASGRTWRTPTIDQHRQRTLRLRPLDAKINGSYEAPWGLRLTPALRLQQGQPYRPNVPGDDELRRAALPRRTIRIAPAGQHHLVDVRVEKNFKLAGKRSLVRLHRRLQSDATRTPRRTSTGVRPPTSCSRRRSSAAAVAVRRQVRLVIRHRAARSRHNAFFRAASPVPQVSCPVRVVLPRSPNALNAVPHAIASSRSGWRPSCARRQRRP